ncbi:MAG TPA: hypothetical protein VKP11_01140 [Frankiaceae bacterium]|nr:hypothetical protein [Frankiaceae bacterium]
MVPTLPGRWQTRVFVLAVVGSLLTLAVTPLLPGRGPLGAAYRATFLVLATVLVVGLGWELVYHGLQQFRWEKDWPTMFGLLTGVNEGLLVWALLAAGAVPGDPKVGGGAFVVDFAVVWVGTWLFVNGPMRVPFLRWRFQGGRLV